MEATSLSEARIYVGTYAKYNDGSIEGKWFDLSDFSDKDEFYEACKELHADERTFEARTSYTYRGTKEKARRKE